MSAHRRKQTGRSKTSGAPETAEQMRDRVLGAYDRWLATKNMPVENTAIFIEVAHTACEFKDNFLGDPNPADWPPGMFTELIGEVFPAKTVGVDQKYARSIIPAMLSYLDFLLQTGRWKLHNDAEGSRRELLALRNSLPDRFGDPSRMSMSGRLINLALEEGIDPSDTAAMSGFIERFNQMPIDWRRKMTDGPQPVTADLGQLPLDEVPDPLRAGVERATALLRAGFDTSAVVRVTVPVGAAEAEALELMPVVGTMRALVEWVGSGRTVTKTGAMRRVDIAEWMDRLGISGSPFMETQSMWDVREIALPWSAAIESGMLELTPTKVKPGPRIAVFESGDHAAQVEFGREVVSLLVRHALGPAGVGDAFGQAIVRVMLPILAMCCRTEGQDLAYLMEIADEMENPDRAQPPDMPTLMISSLVLTQLRVLADLGILVDLAGMAKVPRALRPAVIAAIQGPGAPFELRLAKGAIPLPPVT